MKVWIVFMENLDDHEVHGVYASEDLAAAECTRQNRRDRSVITRFGVDGPYDVVSQ